MLFPVCVNISMRYKDFYGYAPCRDVACGVEISWAENLVVYDTFTLPES